MLCAALEDLLVAPDQQPHCAGHQTGRNVMMQDGGKKTQLTREDQVDSWLQQVGPEDGTHCESPNTAETQWQG